MKKLLFATYHFLPSTAIGAMRPARFTKYLVKHGWESVVITADTKYYDAVDESLSDGQGGPARVIRTKMLRSPSHHYRGLKRIVRVNHDQAGGTGGQTSTVPGKLEERRRLLSTFMSLPDEQVGWCPFAVVRGIEAVRREGVRLILTSGPPHSSHLIGACLSRLTGLPWVADFRDPYLDDVVGDENDRGVALERALAAWLEASFVRRASAVVTTTSSLAERLRSRYPDQGDKVLTISNGYDPEDFVGVCREKDERFTIAHLGTLYGHRNPEPILRAVAELIGSSEIDPKNIRIRLIGQRINVAGRTMESLAARYGLAEAVEVTPRVSRREAFATMVRSHVLIVLAQRQPLAVPAKIFEYLGSGSDILAIAEEGATADLLREAGSGVAVVGDDGSSLRMMIGQLYAKHVSGGGSNGRTSRPEDQSRERYSVRTLAGELAARLEVVEASRRVRVG